MVVSVVLARILNPHTYGLVALITVFTNVLNVFVEGGMGSALIQKKDVDEIDFSSVFFFNIFASSICYTAMFFAAPMIAKFYGDSSLMPIIRVLSLIIIIYGTKNVQQAYVSRHLLFKKFFVATLGGTIMAAAVGIIMAVIGFGVWALVAQYLVNASIDTIVLWLTVNWKPKLQFSGARIKQLFAYGWKLMVSGIIYASYNDFRQLVIGKRYSAADLAYYEKAYTFPRYLVTVVNNSMDSVIFPVMSRSQDDQETLLNLAKKTVKLSTYIMFPLMAGLFACADTVVKIVLTDKWLSCVPYLRAFCFVCAFWSFSTANQNVLKALGKSDILLILEFIEAIINVSILIISMQYGVFAMAIGWCISVVLDQIVVSIPNRKYICYWYPSQLKDILPNLLITIIMVLVVWPLSTLKMNEYIRLFTQMFTGIGIYFAGAAITKNESFTILLEYVKSLIKNRKE